VNKIVKIAKKLLVLVIVLAGLGAGVWGIVQANINRNADAATPGEADRRVAVVCAAIRKMVFEDRIVISGSVETKNTALVSARMPGTLDEIYVDEGDEVVGGKTRVFQTDKVKLTKAVEAAGQQVSVAAAGVRARKATVTRVEADLDKVRIDYERYKRLFEQDRAITRNALEVQESRLKQVVALLAEAKAGVDLAERQSDQADSALAIANKDLADSLVVAPISGKVSRRMLEPGEMAEAGTPVMQVDDLTLVDIAAYIPEAYYDRIHPGKTLLHARIGAVEIAESAITYKSPTIHPKLRTFEIKLLLRNPPQGVVPGALADVVVILARHEALGVPRQAIQRRRGGLAVFTTSEKAARLRVVTVGLENDGWVEVAGEGLAAGVSVVRMGQEQLNDGTAVNEVKEGGK